MVFMELLFTTRGVGTAGAPLVKECFVALPVIFLMYKIMRVLYKNRDTMFKLC